MKYVLFISLIIPSLLIAQSNLNKEAKHKTNYSSEELKRFGQQELGGACNGASGASFSLYSKGQALHGVKQQDQDSLATCYANTASLILKSYNPELPTPSYLDLASHYYGNDNDADKVYDFDSGYTCNVLNNIKKENAKICGNGIVENQATEVQDTILRKLYDVINKYDYSEDQMHAVLNSYDQYIVKNPRPEKKSCGEGSRISIEKYINAMIAMMAESYNYSNSNSNSDYSEAEQAINDKCGEIVKERMMELNLYVATATEYSKYNYGENEMNPKLRSELNKNFLSELKNNVLPSGRSQYDHLVRLLDSKPNSRATYEFVIGDNTEAIVNKETLTRFLEKVNPKIFSSIKDKIADGREDIKKCFDRTDKDDDPMVGMFFNSILGDCYDEIQEWRNDIWENTKSCSDADKDLYTVFKSLTALGQDTKDISNFIVNKDQKILRQIIKNNCKESYLYKMPIQECSYQYVASGLGNINDSKDWQRYQILMADFEEFLKTNSGGEIDLYKLADYLKKIQEEMKAKTAEGESNPILKNYANFARDLFNAVIEENKSNKSTEIYKVSAKQFKDAAARVAKEAKENQLDVGQKITDTLKKGHASGISTCGSLFSNSDKKRFENCQNHAVTATGYKCVKGRLKLELTNSWGIACIDNKKSKNLFECQKDIDGIPNGRAWVDYGYISDQSIRRRSF